MNKYNEKTTEELKEDLLELNNTQVGLLKESALISIADLNLDISDYIYDEEYLHYLNYQTEYETILKIYEDINNVIINGDEEKLLEYRAELYSMNLILEGYFIELDVINELVEEEAIKEIFKRAEYSHIHHGEVDMLINNIEDTLEIYREDFENYNNIISSVINMLNLRITRDNYFDLIKTSLFRSLEFFTKSNIDLNIEDYKKQFRANTRDGYGTKFEHYFIKIEELKVIDLEDADLEELNGEIFDIVSEIQRILAAIYDLSRITNYGLTIFKIDDIKIDLSLLNNLENDLENIENNKEEYFDKNISILSELYESNKEFEKVNNIINEREDFNIADIENTLLKTRELLTIFGDSNFNDIDFLLNRNFERTSKSYLKSQINSLLNYIEISMKGMKNKERKIRMRRLLTLMNLPFNNLNIFLDYVRYSLDIRIIAEEEVAFRISRIDYYLNEMKEALNDLS